MRVSHTALKVLAAATWYIGSGVLLYKGSGYLLEAADAGSAAWPAVAGATGVLVGMMRGRTMFLKACRRNLARIDALGDPRAWQFFRPGFFAALAVMIGGGGVLAWVAETGYAGAVVVGGLELIVGTALLTSSVAFWREGPATGADEAEGLAAG